MLSASELRGLAALGINGDLNVSVLQYGEWNIVYLRDPWDSIGLKIALGIFDMLY